MGKVCFECEAPLPYRQNNVVVTVSVDGKTHERIFAICESHHDWVAGTLDALTTKDLESYKTWLPPA